MGEASRPTKLLEFLLCPMLPLGPVDCHHEDISLKEGSSPMTIVGELWQNWLAGNQLPTHRERFETVLHYQLALIISPCRQDPLGKVQMRPCHKLGLCLAWRRIDQSPSRN